MPEGCGSVRLELDRERRTGSIPESVHGASSGTRRQTMIHEPRARRVGSESRVPSLTVTPGVRRRMNTSVAHRIAVIPGDGIGPEVTAQAVKVLQALGGVELHHLPWSAEHFLATGETVPAGRLRSASFVRRYSDRRPRRSARPGQPARARHPARHPLRARPLRQLSSGAAARRATVPVEAPHAGRCGLRGASGKHGRSLRRCWGSLQGRHRRRDRSAGRDQHLQGRPSHHPACLRGCTDPRAPTRSAWPTRATRCSKGTRCGSGSFGSERGLPGCVAAATSISTRWR